MLQSVFPLLFRFVAGLIFQVGYLACSVAWLQSPAQFFQFNLTAN